MASFCARTHLQSLQIVDSCVRKTQEVERKKKEVAKSRASPVTHWAELARRDYRR